MHILGLWYVYRPHFEVFIRICKCCVRWICRICGVNLFYSMVGSCLELINGLGFRVSLSSDSPAQRIRALPSISLTFRSLLSSNLYSNLYQQHLSTDVTIRLPSTKNLKWLLSAPEGTTTFSSSLDVWSWYCQSRHPLSWCLQRNILRASSRPSPIWGILLPLSTKNWRPVRLVSAVRITIPT